jgi:uncharacterized protein YabE (DUF348 family)
VKQFFKSVYTFFTHHRPAGLLRGIFIIALVITSTTIATNMTKTVLAANTSNDSRLVMIYDNGQERTIVTHAATVADALSDADIVVSKQDDIQPALDAQLPPDAQTSVYIFRARPVMVVDGAKRVRIVTPAQSAAEMAKEAGLDILDGDRTTRTHITDMIANGGAGLLLTITRAKVVHLSLYGQNIDIRTQSATIADLLKEKGITLTDTDTMSAQPGDPITNNMNLQIWRNGVQTVTAAEPIPFDTTTVTDSSQPADYRVVRTPGQTGVQMITYEIEMQDGKEISRNQISSVVVTQPVNQVEVVGTSVPYSGGGNKSDWMRAAGIPEESWGYVDYLVSRESGWNPNAVNRSSGACGLPQALPCSKLGSDWNNPVVALSWMNGYVKRYGGWQGAYQFWQTNHWY